MLKSIISMSDNSPKLLALCYEVSDVCQGVGINCKHSMNKCDK